MSDSRSSSSSKQATTFINCTPHAVRVRTSDGNQIKTYESKGNIRLSADEQLECPNIDGLTILTPPSYSGLIGHEFLYDTNEVKNIIVSMLVGDWLSSNPDVLPTCAIFGPDSSPNGCTRDSKGQIDFVHGLIKYRDNISIPLKN